MVTLALVYLTITHMVPIRKQNQPFLSESEQGCTENKPQRDQRPLGTLET